jgi:hypothetical protein
MIFDKDYYKILDVPPEATLSQIKRSYRSLALRLHPDRVPAHLKQKCEMLFRDINEAYSVLSSAEKKAKYDERTGRYRFAPDYAARAEAQAAAHTSVRSSDDISQEYFTDVREYYTEQKAKVARGKIVTFLVLIAALYALYVYKKVFPLPLENTVFTVGSLYLITMWGGVYIEFFEDDQAFFVSVGMGMFFLLFFYALSSAMRL